ncbi:unnamed protein product [Ambrosiozyma monospora]|uniref:Unnamed protein product n=1 Tax=Ambrosiozyma monospora TaxID=43982 RepID=A0A9W7DJV9_AMBMO|nr:unnamed protein product [Ambrosiozyma monospora]
MSFDDAQSEPSFATSNVLLELTNLIANQNEMLSKISNLESKLGALVEETKREVPSQATRCHCRCHDLQQSSADIPSFKEVDLGSEANATTSRKRSLESASSDDLPLKRPSSYGVSSGNAPSDSAEVYLYSPAWYSVYETMLKEMMGVITLDYLVRLFNIGSSHTRLNGHVIVLPLLKCSFKAGCPIGSFKGMFYRRKFVVELVNKVAGNLGLYPLDAVPLIESHFIREMCLVHAPHFQTLHVHCRTRMKQLSLTKKNYFKYLADLIKQEMEEREM